MGLGPVELLVILFCLGFPVWAVADAVRASDRQWEAIGQSRRVWLVLLVVLTVAALPIGFVLSAVYLLTVRPKLATASRPAAG
jgi:hypothetical protein